MNGLLAVICISSLSIFCPERQVFEVYFRNDPFNGLVNIDEDKLPHLISFFATANATLKNMD